MPSSFPTQTDLPISSTDVTSANEEKELLIIEKSKKIVDALPFNFAEKDKWLTDCEAVSEEVIYKCLSGSLSPVESQDLSDVQKNMIKIALFLNGDQKALIGLDSRTMIWALHSAVRFKDVKIVQILLKLPHMVNSCQNPENAPVLFSLFTFSLLNQDFAIFNEIAKNIGQAEKRKAKSSLSILYVGNSVALDVLTRGSIESFTTVVKFLKEYFPRRIGKYEWQIFFNEACDHNNVVAAEKLISAPPTVRRLNITHCRKAFYSAVATNKREIVQLLLKESNRIILNPVMTKAFGIAVEKNHTELAKTIFDHKVASHKALVIANEAGNAELVQIILNREVSAKIIASCLKSAAQRGYLDHVRMFLDHASCRILPHVKLEALNKAACNNHLHVYNEIIMREGHLFTPSEKAQASKQLLSNCFSEVGAAIKKIQGLFHFSRMGIIHSLNNINEITGYKLDQIIPLNENAVTLAPYLKEANADDATHAQTLTLPLIAPQGNSSAPNEGSSHLSDLPRDIQHTLFSYLASTPSSLGSLVAASKQWRHEIGLWQGWKEYLPKMLRQTSPLLVTPINYTTFKHNYDVIMHVLPRNAPGEVDFPVWDEIPTAFVLKALSGSSVKNVHLTGNQLKILDVISILNGDIDRLDEIDYETRSLVLYCAIRLRDGNLIGEVLNRQSKNVRDQLSFFNELKDIPKEQLRAFLTSKAQESGTVVGGMSTIFLHFLDNSYECFQNHFQEVKDQFETDYKNKYHPFVEVKHSFVFCRCLVAAVVNDDFPLIQMLVQIFNKINLQTRHVLKILEHGNIQAAIAVLELVGYSSFATLFHEACLFGYAEAAITLLVSKKLGDVPNDLKSINRKYGFEAAIQKNQQTVIKRFLEASYLPKFKSFIHDGWDLALRLSRADMLILLYEVNKNLSQEQLNSLLKEMNKAGKLDFMKLLLSRHSFTQKIKGECLKEAAAAGQLNVIKLWLHLPSGEINESDKQETLCQVATYEHFTQYRLLLEQEGHQFSFKARERAEICLLGSYCEQLGKHIKHRQDPLEQYLIYNLVRTLNQLVYDIFKVRNYIHIMGDRFFAVNGLLKVGESPSMMLPASSNVSPEELEAKLFGSSNPTLSTSNVSPEELEAKQFGSSNSTLSSTPAIPVERAVELSLPQGYTPLRTLQTTQSPMVSATGEDPFAVDMSQEELDAILRSLHTP